MSDELGSEIRERLRQAELPPAPDDLHARLSTIASGPPAGARRIALAPSLRRFVPLAAVLVIAIGVGAAFTRLDRSVAPPSPGTSAGAGDWGPLAVADLDEAPAARAEGTLLLTDRCAFLVAPNGERSLLVWPASRTSWDTQARAVTVGRLQASSPVTVRSGQRVEVGGGGSSVREDGLSAPEWAARFDWLATPAPECLTDQRWVISDVVDLTAVTVTEPPGALLVIVCPEASGAISCEQAAALALARLDPTHGPIRYVKVTRPPRACTLPSIGGTCTPDVMVEVVFADPRVGVALVAVNPGADGIVAGEVLRPPPPEVMCDEGSYPGDAMTCDAAVDAAMSLIGTDHPRIARITFVHSCDDVSGGPSDCAVQYSGLVSITYDTSPQTTAIVFVQGTSVGFEARFVNAATPEIHCTEAPEPARTCGEIVDAVLAALGPNHPPIARIDVPTICRGGLIPWCSRADWVDAWFAGTHRLQVRLPIRETPSGAFVEDLAAPATSRFDPPYSTVSPTGEGPWIWRADLSGDGRTLSVEFFAPAGLEPCAGAYEPWVGRDGDNLLVKIVRVDRPLPSPLAPPSPSLAGLPRGIEVIGCPFVGIRHHFDIALPEPFTGTTVRDLNGGILVLAP